MKTTKKDWLRINNILRSRNIAHDQTKHINCFRFHPTESKAHRDEKFRICSNLYDRGHPFLCEVWTADRKRRFDILDLEDDVVIEIETNFNVDKGDMVKTVRI